MVWLEQFWDFLEEQIFCLPSSQDARRALFNPYCESDPALEVPDAAAIRRHNLRNFLTSLPARPRVLIVGEAPGWRGCRFSGVPFTSETQIVRNHLPFSGSRTSAQEKPVSEASASLFWEVLFPYFPDFMVWNCVPLHPHIPGSPRSNRRLTLAELCRFLPHLTRIHAVLQPYRVLAVGRFAQQALSRAGIEADPIRHPSHGGASAFRDGVQAIFNRERDST